MSASKEWTEWHLTPRGWERGSERIDFKGVTKKEAPNDRQLTYKFHLSMSSGFSPLARRIEKVWQSDNTEGIAVLIEEFGECPEKL